MRPEDFGEEYRFWRSLSKKPGQEDNSLAIVFWVGIMAIVWSIISLIIIILV